MRENDVLFGFRVTRMRVFPELGGALVELEHEKTGAAVCWLNRPDENMAFILSFKTPSTDSSGVFHILQHSVYRGSDKYPIRDIFSEFKKNSVQTFFNDRTYPDKTVFICSSRNDHDFLNLLDIDLNAVLHPAFYHRPEVFRQEGWRYEPEEKTLNYQGNVLNEMKVDAALVDSAMDNEICRILYPDTCYRFESGGNPEQIPDLTYEKLCATHETHYHPSNLRISLVGEIDIDSVLEKIDSSLDGYERRPVDFPIPLQQPIPASANVLSYEIEEDEPLEDRAVIGCGMLLGAYDDRERLFAASLLFDYLVGDAEAPLRRAVIDRGLAEKFEVVFFDYIQQPVAYWQATNTDQAKLPLLYAVIRQTLSEIVEQGLDHERFEACFQHFAFQKRDRDADVWPPRSVNEGLDMLNTWLYGGDPADALLIEPILDALSKKLRTGYFEQLIRELFLENRHTATVLLVPSHTFGAEKREKERARLEAVRAVWTDDDYARLNAETEALRTWQQTPDSPEALAAIPKLTLSDLNDQPAPLHCDPITQNGVPVLHHTVYSNLAYLKAFFAANDLPIDDLPLLKTMCGLLGKLPTALYERDELPLAIKRTIGRLNIEPRILPGTSPDRCRVLLSASVACTKELAKSAAELLGELLTQTIWEDIELTRETLRQMLITARSPLLKDGYQYAASRVCSSLTAHGAADERINGISYLRWLERTIQTGDFSALLERMQALAVRIFTQKRLTLSCSETVPKAALYALTRTLPETESSCDAEATYRPDPILQEGIVIPSANGFVATGSSLSRHRKQFSGSLPVLSRILDSYLWNEIRMQGGANKGSFNIDKDGYLMFFTAKDPQPARSIDVIRRTPEFVRKYVATEPDLTGAILSSASTVLDPLRNAEEKMTEAEDRWFRGISEETIVLQYQQLLNTMPQDLLTLCDALEDVVRDNAICIISNRNQLTECGDLLNTIVSV